MKKRNFKIALFIIACLVLFVCYRMYNREGFSVCSPGPVKQGTAITGTMLSSFGGPQLLNASACSAACCENERCRGYNFMLTADKGGLCILMEKVSGERAAPGSSSGTVTRVEKPPPGLPPGPPPFGLKNPPSVSTPTPSVPSNAKPRVLGKLVLSDVNGNDSNAFVLSAM